MENPLIITIGREYGSGGRQIGEILANKLGIAFYDKKIISLAAEKSGLSSDFIENNEQREYSGFFQNVAASAAYTNGFFAAPYTPLTESIFISQSQVIRDIAQRESAVIVGRCADYVLANRPNTINVFIHAPLDARVQRIMSLYHLDEAGAMKAIAKSDKERGNHYFRYTDKKWGKAQNYHVCINSALLGVERTAEMLADLAGIEEHKGCVG